VGVADERSIETADRVPVTASKRLGTILTEAIIPADGALRVPAGPGLGIELDDDEVGRRTVR
jgi:L-alanine-DL-glutamate epimerase-like enolase superfamily enzyme